MAWKSVAWWVGICLVVVFRANLCFQPPIETSDLYRHLGYSSQLPEQGFRIYRTIASDFAPQFWTSFWTHQGYIYPPAILSFFGLFSIAGIGLGWVKLILTLFDLGSVFLLRRYVGRWAALLVFLAPLNIWFVSHEGQFDSLIAFFLILSTSCLIEKKWFAAGVSWMIALQMKQFAILLAPYWILVFLSIPKEERAASLSRSALGLTAGLLPFIGFYLDSPDIWLRPLSTQSLQFNPYYWNPWSASHAGWTSGWLIEWNGLMSYLPLLVLLAFIVFSWRTEKAPLWPRILAALPLILFLGGIKVLSWGQFWYLLVAPAFFMPLFQKRRVVLVLFALYLLIDARSLRLLTGASLWGVGERQETVERFQSCLHKCDYRAKF